MRTVLLLAFFAVSTGAVCAQVVQFHPFAGYALPSSLNMSEGSIHFAGAPTVGFNLSMGMGDNGLGIFRNALFELHYSYLHSDMLYRFTDDDLSAQPMGDVIEHTILIGCTRETAPRRWAGFGGIYFGVVSMAPQDIFYNTRTRFTFSFAGGIKYAFNEKAGLRMNAQASLPIWKSGYYARWTTISQNSGVVTSSLQFIGSISLGLYLNLIEIH